MNILERHFFTQYEYCEDFLFFLLYTANPKQQDYAKACLCTFKRQDHIVIPGLSTSWLWRWTDSGSGGGVCVCVCVEEGEGVGGVSVGVS